MSNAADILIWYPVFVFSTTCHEFAHSYAAYRGGDLTAYEGGQVSLDPLPHIRRSPFGMVIVPLISFLQSGWMIGWASAPYDPRWASRYPRRHAAMSFAGPLANLMLALIALAAIWALLYAGVFLPVRSPSFNQIVEVPEGSPFGSVAMALSILLNLNVLLGFLNLMPIPPLDGAGVLEGLSPPMASLYERMRRVPMFSILGWFVAMNLFSVIALPILIGTLRVVYWF